MQNTKDKQVRKGKIMGFLDGLLNVASAAIDFATEYATARQDQLFEEQVRQENAQLEEFMEMIKGVISKLREVIADWDGEIEDITNAALSNNRDDILSELGTIECMAGVYGDEKWFKENFSSDDPGIDTLLECMNSWQTLAKFTDETFDETDEEEGCTRQHLMLDAGRLAHRIHMLLEDIEDKDLYQASQTAIKYINDFQKSIKNAIHHWNLLLEDGYNYLCDDDDDDDEYYE